MVGVEFCLVILFEPEPDKWLVSEGNQLEGSASQTKTGSRSLSL